MVEAGTIPAVGSTVRRGNGKYKLIGVVSHMGRNTEHGHYVCHLLRDGQWVLFNDDKVSRLCNIYAVQNTLTEAYIALQVSSCRVPPLEYGFMYFYGPADDALAPEDSA